MKAVVWVDFGKIEVREMPVPSPGPEEVLVRVKAATLCKTDIAMIQHGILGIQPPVIIGHEVSGVVAACGEHVIGLEAGQLVALDPPVPCRRCRVCLAGFRHMCPNTRHIGAHIAGGMAEYIAIDYRNAYPVPVGVSPLAASIAEPVASTMQALSRAGGVAGKTVCVFGDGPFGILACRMAHRQGAAQVLLFGHHAARMALVQEYGVQTYDERGVDPGAVIREHTDGYGADAIVDTTGVPAVIAGAIGWLIPRGTLVLFTPAGGPVNLDLPLVHFREINIHGSCRSLDLFPEALQAMREDPARTEALISCTLPIDEVERGFALIANSKESIVKAAIVFE